MNTSLRRVLLAIVIGLFCTAVDAQGRLQRPVEIKTHEVRGSVHMLTGRGGNIGVLASDAGVIMIDDQFAAHADGISEAVAKLSSQPIRFLINTHWHGDHTGGNKAFAKKGVVVVAHDNVRQRMSKENFNELFQRGTPPAEKEALPSVTFTDAMTFHWGGEEVRVMHVAKAHTDGDSFVHFATSNVLHMGDVFFNGMYPFVDTSSGGNIVGVIDAVKKALAICTEETKIIPGHGPLATVADLRSYLTMLEAARAAVAKLIKSGKSLEEIIEAAPLADYDQTWGTGFMKPANFLKCVHWSLDRKSDEATDGVK